MHLSHNSHQSRGAADKLARNLGWLGIGLGVCKLAAPGMFTRSLGANGHEGMVRMCGGREIVSGVMALSHNPSPAIWSRVAGDIGDLVGLMALYNDRNPNKANVGLALSAVATTTALDIYCAKALAKRHAYQSGPTPDYSERSGFPRPVEEMRGVAKDYRNEASQQPKAALPSPAMVGKTPADK
ncbi:MULTISPECIES: hypothetical protein [Halomonadaceae]|uniref:hypothetical protein n=1 Tax=Halomonadaceae TaxID=28256 RepID=UPI00159B1167|nr:MULTISPECIES: hypothetical protein [Halomonas]QJQ95819.1 hypothetical protein HIO72_11420 [Halomonas sp. PA5]